MYKINFGTKSMRSSKKNSVPPKAITREELEKVMRRNKSKTKSKKKGDCSLPEDWVIGKFIKDTHSGQTYEATRDDGLVGVLKILEEKDKKTGKYKYPSGDLNVRDLSIYTPIIYKSSSTLKCMYHISEKFDVSLRDYIKTNKISSPQAFGIAYRLVTLVDQLYDTLNSLGNIEPDPDKIMIVEDDPKRGIVVNDFCNLYPLINVNSKKRKEYTGNPEFRGPLAWAKKNYSLRDDLESIGLILAWILLGGRLPWSGMSTKDMKKMIIDKDMPAKLAKECKNPTIEKFLKKANTFEYCEYCETADLKEFLSMLGGHIEDLF